MPEKEVKPITDNELNEVRNLQKKMKYYQEMLGQGGAQTTESSESDGDDEVDEIQPKKKNIKQQRMGVSAEVFGAHNKKGDFKAPVI